MSNTKEICTTYRVLEIREPVGGSGLAPIVIIAEKVDTKERRRIEIRHHNSPAFEDAKKLISGDTFSFHEWVLDDGRRLMKSIITYFNEEEMAIDGL